MRYENMPGMKKSHFLSFVVNMMQLSSDIRFLKLFSEAVLFAMVSPVICSTARCQTVLERQ